MIKLVTVDHWIDDVSLNTKSLWNIVNKRIKFSLDLFRNDHLTISIL